MNSHIEKYLADHRVKHLEELFSLLSIPSVSSLSEHKEDVKKGAEWLADALKKIGMEHVQVLPTKGHPVVYGDWLHAEGAPTVLVYGHYDVQPVDPLNLWETPPFEPSIRENKLYARGASDDKGQVFMHLKAIEAIMQSNGSLPINVKFLIEGEEEIGSPSLPHFVEENKDLLQADVIVISDTGLYDEGQPTVCYGLRGLCGVQIDIKGTKGDLHSGLYGGAVPNAAKAIVDLLATFHDSNHKVSVDGFYDKVLPLTQAEKEAYEALDFDEEKTRQELDIPELVGEQGYSFLERTWVRPTLEVNGIYGGFQGEGIKTVIPSEAHAKVTCRLVPDQDPDEIVELLKAHIEKHKPAGVTVSVSVFDKGAPYVTPFEHPAIQAAARSYEKVYNVPTKFTRGGGSIPIVAAFDELLKLPVVLMGFGLASENFHAPNEHFHLENYDKGLLTICDYWFELAKSL